MSVFGLKINTAVSIAEQWRRIWDRKEIIKGEVAAAAAAAAEEEGVAAAAAAQAAAAPLLPHHPPL